MRIEKKIWPEYFDRVVSGEKHFELRLADWACKSGDVLALKEWDPKAKAYTGRSVEKKVTFVFKTKDQKFWSADDVEKQKRFSDKHEFDYPLLSDPDGAVATQFGVRRRVTVLTPTKRATFVIGTDRRVLGVVRSEVRMNLHADKALVILKASAASA